MERWTRLRLIEPRSWAKSRIIVREPSIRFAAYSSSMHAGRAKNGYNCTMSMPILATKLYLPPPRASEILRPRLTERLNAGLHRKLTLIAAPAGFGKTTLVSEWVASLEARDVRREASEAGLALHNHLTRTALQASSLKPLASKVAWLSLDE